MTKSFPYLALDSAGKRTILCDHPVKMFDNTTKEKKAKMAHVMTNQEVQSHTKKLVARLLGQDAAIDDETAGKIKEFLKSRLSAADHEKMCNMLAGDAEAQDTEPPPNDVDAKPRGQLAGDAKARDDFFARFPDAARIRIDTSGIQPPARAASYSADGAKSFFELFPDARRINLA